MYKLIILVVVLLGASVLLNTVISSTGEKKPENESQAKSKPSPGSPLTEQMFTAVHASDYKTIDKLIKKDPDLVNKIHAQGGTFINCAVTASDLKMLNYLLDHGAKPDGNAECGTTGLQIAVRSNLQQLAQALISRGANINAFTEDNKTVLDMARQAGKPGMVEFLLKNGAKSSKELPKPAPKSKKPAKTGPGKMNHAQSHPKGW
jgi:ankyrin repeat protein